MADQYNQQGCPAPGPAGYPLQALDKNDLPQVPDAPSDPAFEQYHPPPSYGYKPPTDTSNNTVVLQNQSTTAVTTVSPPAETNSKLVRVALVLSCTALLFISVGNVVCTIPAIILAIVATRTTGSVQKRTAGASIGFSVASLACHVLTLVVILPASVSLSLSASSYSRTYSYRPSYYHSSYYYYG